ncbi:hypothetical protein N7481_003920 [Penicillium waksmanii]|uniref:uncharacterized protein n=1 Tax=Penicillium waksmanii TaxID=69791 RepID=UPI002548C8CD|nr:uncharacterized protein N7481_003920 [Penicillium waksmanii]KAJ5988710.1 hypothetical protein N7481_003920 [Penicillium waksmanii]
MGANQTRTPIEPRYERRFGEYLESILRANPSQPSSDSVEVVILTPNSLSDPLPMQESIEESDYNELSDAEATSIDECDPLVPSYDKTCIWCEWEKAEAKEYTGTPCPSHHNESTGVNFNENTPDLFPRNSQMRDFLGSRASFPYGKCSDRPGRCLPQELPPLLFRWWNKNSHGLNTRTLLMAAAFAKAESPVERVMLEGMGREDFLLAFKNHVTKARVDSPFISLFKSPLSPIHRAVRHQDGAVISVIDPSKLERDVNWKGFGEYEVWEKIEGPAIVCTFDIRTLMNIDHDNPVIGGFLQLLIIRGYDSGSNALHVRLKSILKSHHDHDMALSRLMELLEVPEQYRASMCHCFKKSWFENTIENWTQGELEASRSVSPRNEVYIHPVDIPVLSYPLPFTPPERYRRSVSEKSYKPPRRDEETEGESSEEEKSSQSPAARCPRHDTPSSGYSVRDESDDEDAYRKFNAKQFRAHPPIPINFAGRDEIEQTPDVSDMEMVNEWPSEGEHYQV